MYKRKRKKKLLSVKLSHKIEPKTKNTSIKAALKTFFVREFPFVVNDTERDILVWRTNMKSNQRSFRRVSAVSRFN